MFFCFNASVFFEDGLIYSFQWYASILNGLKLLVKLTIVSEIHNDE